MEHHRNTADLPTTQVCATFSISAARREIRDHASLMKNYLAIINPAAGGGRCGKLAARTLQQLRSHGLTIEVVETRQPGDATRIARESYAQGFRRSGPGGTERATKSSMACFS
jgi:hypothetical protein